MGTTRKQIAFDLDTNALKTYYPTESWNNAYDVIRRHMEKNGFRWLQGSVYVSNELIPSYRVAHILNALCKNNPWMNMCMRDCRETNIGKEHDRTYFFNKNAKIPTREELMTKKSDGHGAIGNMKDYMSQIAKAKATKEVSSLHKTKHRSKQEKNNR